MNIKYVSDDGTTFETKEECLSYEEFKKRPCPFCGVTGETRYIRTYGSWGYSNDEERIHCNFCDFTLNKELSGENHPWYEVIKVWNKLVLEEAK